MIKTSIEKISKEIGYDIGMSDDVVQSDLLNGFFEALTNSIQQKNNLEMQICYIVEKLTKKSKGRIKDIYEFIKLKDNEELLKNE